MACTIQLISHEARLAFRSAHCVASRARSISASIAYVIMMFMLSMAAQGQSPQVLLGIPQVQSAVDSNSTGTAEAFQVIANSPGQVDSLFVFLDRSNTAGMIWAGVYENNHGHPSRLLSQAAIQQTVSGGWNAIRIHSLQVRQGERYWLALLSLNGQLKFRDGAGNCYSETSRQTSLTSLPTIWRTGLQWSTCVVSMFASSSAPANVGVIVSPTTASLQPGQQSQFTANVSGTSDTAVTWTATGGTVTSGGQYTAPLLAGTYTITVTSVADSSKSASAVVTVSQPAQISLSLSPGAASLQSGGQQQFAASVSGTTNTAVTWKTSGGIITGSGLFTAPSAAGNYAVVATSVADPSKSASALVTVSQPTPVSLSVSPGAADLQSGAQQQFTAFVSGTSNTAVTWSSSGGTVNSSSGLYTAPSAAGTYTVTATSAADATKSASATVNVMPSQAIAVSISPTTVSMPEQWRQQFSAKVSGSSNTTVTWAVATGRGTITQSGLYTAPQTVETDVIVATSQADNTRSSSATITVVAPHSVVLSWSPSSSPDVNSYNVYRGTMSGGSYSLLQKGVSSTSFTDSNVLSGNTYYYVTTAVGSNGAESTYSSEAPAAIPMP